MNKLELISAVAEKSNLTKKDTEIVLNALIETITNELGNKGEVKLVGFGTFCTSERKERTGRNPQTNEAITIPACTVPKFKASKVLKDAVNNK